LRHWHQARKCACAPTTVLIRNPRSSHFPGHCDFSKPNPQSDFQTHPSPAVAKGCSAPHSIPFLPLALQLESPAACNQWAVDICPGLSFHLSILSDPLRIVRRPPWGSGSFYSCPSSSLAQASLWCHVTTLGIPPPGACATPPPAPLHKHPTCKLSLFRVGFTDSLSPPLDPSLADSPPCAVM